MREIKVSISPRNALPPLETPFVFIYSNDDDGGSDDVHNDDEDGDDDNDDDSNITITVLVTTMTKYTMFFQMNSRYITFDFKKLRLQNTHEKEKIDTYKYNIHIPGYWIAKSTPQL